MNDDGQVRALLEEALNSGRTPEEVCAAHPEYLEEVRTRWYRIRALTGELERVFPSSGRTWSGDDLNGGVRVDEPARIPGYQIEGVIGHGGMGVVYKARHINLDRLVAIKMLRAGDHASAKELAGLVKEAQSIAALKHPHIVQVHDVGELNGLPFFTMEFVEGGSLARRLDGKPLPSREAASLVATLAETVHAAHAGGIVHRDLKPANVLIGADGAPKITDFGLARQMKGDPRDTLSPAGVGTPSYMAPEQALSTQDAYGPCVDVYALGAVLYELLTGRPPFRAESNLETQRQVVSQEPVPPTRLNPRVPRDVETICLKCLQKSPLRRYATAREVEEDLRRFLAGEPILARSTGRLERVAKWVRRHPAQAVAGAGVTIGIAAILGAVLWTLSQRAAVERAVSDDLSEAVRLERASDWRAARNTLELAKTRLAAAAGRDRLATRATEIERELNLVDRLGEMRLSQRASAELEFDRGKWWREYRAAFMQAGLLAEGDTPEAFAARVAASPVRTALIEAMDDMTMGASKPGELEWLLSAARLADPEPEWRDKARDPTLWKDTAALAALAHDAPVEKEPVTILLIVAGRLLQSRPDQAERLLRKVQTAHPSDFWTNFALAEALDDREDADAIGYYRAAIALRPEAAAAHFNLAWALNTQNRMEEAIESMIRAAALDPRNWVPQHNLSVWLLRQRRIEDGIQHARLALRLGPNEARAHHTLGRALAMATRYCEAAESFRLAVELSPNEGPMQKDLDRALRECESASGKPPAPQEQ